MSYQDYQTVAQLLERLNTAKSPNTSLESLGLEIGLSALQTQRLFSRWVGISPKRFQQYLTAKSLRQQLSLNQSLLDLSYSNGLSSPSRAHDHCVQLFAMSPAECRQQGKGILIQHGFHPSPFGECHIAVTHKGICWLAFTQPLSRSEALLQLQHEWSNADIKASQTATEHWLPPLFSNPNIISPLHVHIKGTNFQLKVWEALLQIPSGELSSYGDIAKQVGHPGAARAVGTAIGQNLISWLIPCHRVIRASGVVGHYRWGRSRKQTMIARELAAHPREGYTA